jgi:GDP-D-mannose 3', 5'-epimerase
MGGAGYIFTGNNDANVMHNSALVNLNVAHEAVKQKKLNVYSTAHLPVCIQNIIN